MAVALMVVDRRVEKFRMIRASLTLPVAPLQYIVNLPTRLMDDMHTHLNSHDELVKQNQKLQQDSLLLHSQLQRLEAIESENNYLKALLHSAKQVKAKTLIAELLAVASEPFVNQVILDKGVRDGVYEGQPVLDATGVMGQISQVGPISSRVLLLNDPHSGIAVENTRNGFRAIAVGDGYTGTMQLRYVTKTADIHVGDQFMTSGLGDHYPAGYPVGKVISVMNDPAHQFIDVVLQPNARINSSRQVLLIWYQKNA